MLNTRNGQDGTFKRDHWCGLLFIVDRNTSQSAFTVTIHRRKFGTTKTYVMMEEIKVIISH